MSRLRFPEPYDFELSTERFRRFGPDLANRLARRRAASGPSAAGRSRSVPRPAASTSSRSTTDTRPVVLTLLGAPFELDAVLRMGGGRRRARADHRQAGADFVRRSRPIRSRRSSPRSPPSRSRCSPRSRSATRLIERFGVPVGRVYAFPTRERLAGAAEEELVAVGFSRRKAEYVVGLARSDLDLDALAALDDDEVRARIVAAARARPVDRRMVPRPPPRAAARLAGRRPRPAQGGRRFSTVSAWRRSGRGSSRSRTCRRTTCSPGRVRRERPSRDDADETMLRELWEEFEREVPEPLGFDAGDAGRRSGATRVDDIRAGGVFLAEDDDGARSASRGSTAPDHGAMHVQLVHVRPAARRDGVAKALLRACVAYARAADAPHDLARTSLIAQRACTDDLGPTRLHRRVDADGGPGRRPRGAARRARAGRAASDDARADRRRDLGASARSRSSCRGSSTPDVRNSDSWIRVADPVLDGDRDAHGRFAHELSERLGAVTVALALGGRGRSLPTLRAWTDGRRVPVGADLLRRASRRATSLRWPPTRRSSRG